MNTTVLKGAGLGAAHGERSFPSGQVLMDRVARGVTGTFKSMIAARERAAMVAVRRYAEQSGIDLDVVKAEMARTMGSDEHTPRNTPHAGVARAVQTPKGRVTRF
jgi:hypothetical protein